MWLLGTVVFVVVALALLPLACWVGSRGWKEFDELADDTK